MELFIYTFVRMCKYDTILIYIFIYIYLLSIISKTFLLFICEIW